MKRRLIIGLIVVLGIILVISFAGCTGGTASKSAVPLPPAEAKLPKLKVEPWLQVEASGAFLEGPAFDRAGNLFVSSIFDNRILKITPEKQVTTIFSQDGLMPDGIAIHKDGRLFVVCLGGKIMILNADGSNPTYIDARYQDKPAAPNDLVFDSKGNFYVTDFIGTASDPAGGVYWFSSDFNTVKPVFEHMATTNGVGLSPEGNVLWVSETSRMQIHRLELLEDGVTVNPVAGAGIPYRFTGGPGGCDSMAIDSEGNVYQCLIFQGRILVLNKGGFPIAQVLIPGRDEGKLLRSTNVAFKPGTDEVYITTSDDNQAWIYKFRGLAKGLTLFSHQ